eukprot:scaffold10043_cov27-Tisochrysis_lutea.AAC.4
MARLASGMCDVTSPSSRRWLSTRVIETHDRGNACASRFECRTSRNIAPIRFGTQDSSRVKRSRMVPDETSTRRESISTSTCTPVGTSGSTFDSSRCPTTASISMEHERKIERSEWRSNKHSRTR